jgi:glycosyltransferase involved in cell wall biosynthesis
MNVWIFQTGEPLHSDKGKERPMRAMNLANILLEKGHNVIIWSSCFYHQKKIQRAKLYKKKIINKKLEIRLIPSPGYKKNISIGRLFDHIILAYNLKKKLDLEKKLPDVAFVGYPPIETAFIMTSWLKKKKIPYLLDIKDQWPLIFIEIAPKILQPLIQLILLPYFLIAKKIFKDSPGICAMTKSFIDWSLNFSNRKKSKFDIVTPLTAPCNKLNSLEMMRTSFLWWAKKGLVQNKVFRIIFIGSYSAVFNFDLIFNAANQLLKKDINCEFVFCGDGDLKEFLKIKSKNFSNVKIIDWIDLPRALALSKISSAFIAPYKNRTDFMKSIPNKIIDAINFGIPILSPLKGDVEDLIKKNKIGFVYHDQKSLVNAIYILVNNKNLHKKMSNNAKKLYQDKFEFSKVYSQLVKNLENLKKINNER